LEHDNILESDGLRDSQLSDLESFSLPLDFPTMEDLDGALNQLLEEENFADNLGEFEQTQDIRELGLELETLSSEGSSLEINCLRSAGEEGMSKIVDHESKLQLCIPDQLPPGIKLSNELSPDLPLERKVCPFGELRDCTQEIISKPEAGQATDLMPNTIAVHSTSMLDELFLSEEKVKCKNMKCPADDGDNLPYQGSHIQSEQDIKENKLPKVDNCINENNVDVEESCPSQPCTPSISSEIVENES